MYSGITDFRLKGFNVDNSVTAILNFGEIGSDTLVTLKELSDTREVGMIICEVEMLEDLRKLIKQLKELNENR
jgi:vacuolar-type H+-ATPase subunit F/Vma7